MSVKLGVCLALVFSFAFSKQVLCLFLKMVFLRLEEKEGKKKKSTQQNPSKNEISNPLTTHQINTTGTHPTHNTTNSHSTIHNKNPPQPMSPYCCRQPTFRESQINTTTQANQQSTLEPTTTHCATHMIHCGPQQTNRKSLFNPLRPRPNHLSPTVTPCSSLQTTTHRKMDLHRLGHREREKSCKKIIKKCYYIIIFVDNVLRTKIGG